MLKRFLITLLASWVVNPLGILVAQWFGVANTPTVILVLLASGACVPFQLLMNECIAACESRGQARTNQRQRTLLLAMQAATCAIAIWGLTEQRFPVSQVAVVVGMLVINTNFSYRISLRYYRLVSAATLSIRSAIMIGAIPGLTSLLLYLAYCLAARHESSAAVPLIIASTIVPTLVQWCYLRLISKSVDRVIPNAFDSHHTLVTGWLLAASFALSVLAASSTNLREAVATLSADHVALLLVALNSLLSLVNTATRAKFLVREGRSIKGLLASVAALSVAAFGVAHLMQWGPSAIFALVATQASIAWVIDWARRLPTTDTRLRAG